MLTFSISFAFIEARSAWILFTLKQRKISDIPLVFSECLSSFRVFAGPWCYHVAKALTYFILPQLGIEAQLDETTRRSADS